MTREQIELLLQRVHDAQPGALAPAGNIYTSIAGRNLRDDMLPWIENALRELLKLATPTEDRLQMALVELKGKVDALNGITNLTEVVDLREIVEIALVELDRATDRRLGKKVCAPTHVIERLREIARDLDGESGWAVGPLNEIADEMSGSTLESVPLRTPPIGRPFVRCPVWSSDENGSGLFHCGREEGHQGEHSREAGGEHPFEDGDTP